MKNLTIEDLRNLLLMCGVQIDYPATELIYESLNQFNDNPDSFGLKDFSKIKATIIEKYAPKE